MYFLCLLPTLLIQTAGAPQGHFGPRGVQLHYSQSFPYTASALVCSCLQRAQKPHAMKISVWKVMSIKLEASVLWEFWFECCCVAEGRYTRLDPGVVLYLILVSPGWRTPRATFLTNVLSASPYFPFFSLLLLSMTLTGVWTMVRWMMQ